MIEILTAKMSVTISSHDFEDAGIDGEEGHIESATAEIEHKDLHFLLLLVFLFVEPVS